MEDQPYIHYNKGSLALYALRDLIGETAMNAALAGFVSTYGFKSAPYPTSRDLVRVLTAATPDSLRYAIGDLFETVTLWDLRTERVTSVRRPDGRYDVTIRGGAHKFRVDSLGVQHEVPVGDLVDLGVFGGDGVGGRPLWLGKVWVRRNDPVVTVTVNTKPASAGFDPHVKLIDKDRRDNLAVPDDR